MGIKARSSKIAPATGSGDSGLPYGSAAASGGKSSACHGRPRTGRRYCRYSDPWSTAGEASGNFIAKHDDACSDSEGACPEIVGALTIWVELAFSARILLSM